MYSIKKESIEFGWMRELVNIVNDYIKAYEEELEIKADYKKNGYIKKKDLKAFCINSACK